jgi:saccharopine dehydrogenase-like NADP-dependent oxidoreductase
MFMKKIVIVGAGKIGSVIAEMLAESGDYAVTLVDRDAGALERLPPHRSVAAQETDIEDAAALAKLFAGKDAVVSAAPFNLTPLIAQAAHSAGVHYLDLTEDVASTNLVKQLGKRARAALIPQCGLGPGFVSIMGHDLARRFDEVQSLRLRVGALPAFPTNTLKYNLTWSLDGVLNEYCHPCEAIVDGVLRKMPALEELETFSLDGGEYEAFNTSGGVGTLAETLQGRIRNLNYRTIRYPGHCAILRTLINDLNLGRRFDMLRDIFLNAVPATDNDVVVIAVIGTGIRGGRLVEDTYAKKIYAERTSNGMRTAIQRTTASSLCAVLDLLFEGHLPSSGFVRQEDVPLDRFLANRFGSIYAN